MKSVAIIACPNGFGHTRRLLCLSEQLIVEGYNVTLFCPRNAFFELTNILNFQYIPTFIEFSLPNFNGYWQSLEIYSLSFFPDLSPFDYVVSDNLLDILCIRKDAILSASFFWHKTFVSTPSAKHDYYQSLLEKYQPKIYASSLFALPYIRNYPNVFFEKLFKPSSFKAPTSRAKTSILISTGRGGEIKKSVHSFLYNNPNWSNLLQPFNIFLEPSLVNTNLDSNIFPATYDRAMYSSCKFALIRPGVGSITDCLLYQVLPIYFYEDFNLEMVYNATHLATLELGINMKSFSDSYSKCIELILDDVLYGKFVVQLTALDIFGDSIISSCFNE